MWHSDTEMSPPYALVSAKGGRVRFCHLRGALALCSAYIQLAKILAVFPSLLAVDFEILLYLTLLHVKLDTATLLPFSCELAMCS